MKLPAWMRSAGVAQPTTREDDLVAVGAPGSDEKAHGGVRGAGGAVDGGPIDGRGPSSRRPRPFCVPTGARGVAGDDGRYFLGLEIKNLT